MGIEYGKGRLSPPQYRGQGHYPRKFLRCDIQICRFWHILMAIKTQELSTECVQCVNSTSGPGGK